MKLKFTVQRVVNPSDAEINTSVQLFYDLMHTNNAAISLAGGDLSLLKLQAAGILRAGALAGEYYTATNEDGEIVGYTLWMPPGQELFSTDEQRALGYNEFMARLSDEGQAYFKTGYRARFADFLSSHLGPTGQKDAWWLHMAMVRADYQRQGILRALFELVHEKASNAGDTLACTASDENVAIYLALGFTHRGTTIMPSPWGDWKANLFSLKSSALVFLIAMQLVDHDTFLKQLTALFESTKEQGTIWLTHKRLTHDGDDAAMIFEDGSSDTREYPCLVRVTDGKSTKLSTRVDPGQLPKFQAIYGSLLKASMTSLRKRDKKRDKQRLEQAAKRKKKMTEPVVLDGKKRGSGRRQRQRKFNALLKQQESQKKFREREEDRKKAEVVV